MTNKLINEMISELCGIEASPKDVKAINKVIDFLDNLRKEESK
jgi:hypothetical protein